MIVAERKPMEELLQMTAPFGKILVAGCGACVTVCMAGGEKEVEVLSSLLLIERKKNGKELEARKHTVERQCEPEFIKDLDPRAEGVEMILSMACGVGVQYLAERYPKIPVYPALNTKFMGGPVQQGIWTEKCGGCGNCILSLTGGICPIARCSKSLLNGPCGGSENGKCEVDPKNIDCAWQLIFDRMKNLGKLEILAEIQPPKDWSYARDGGPRKIVREDAVL
ncbi:MAG: methylenetetrahydrofolate reductase C-terminal domain-containing protein [Firmicutes bacterium]|nr:methylenetetrahydrofolate reductase C-terminal domain-containing protein [Bacillota bacterium]